MLRHELRKVPQEEVVKELIGLHGEAEVLKAWVRVSPPSLVSCDHTVSLSAWNGTPPTRRRLDEFRLETLEKAEVQEVSTPLGPRRFLRWPDGTIEEDRWSP